MGLARSSKAEGGLFCRGGGMGRWPEDVEACVRRENLAESSQSQLEI
jgi:hypothetical protein